MNLVMVQVFANALMTWPFIITVLFCIGDIDELLASPLFFTSPFTQVVYNSTGSVAASIILNMMASLVAFAAGFDLYGAAARMIWTLSRDKALPSWLSVIHPKWDVPVNALLVLILPAIVVPMIYIWNSTAFYGIMAGVLVFFQLSYIIPIILNVTYARWNGSRIRPAWSLGRFGLPIDILSCCFSAYTIIFQSFPVYQPVDAITM
jgi:choline transport protein